VPERKERVMAVCTRISTEGLDWPKLASWCLRTSLETSSRQQQIDWEFFEDECFLWSNSVGEHTFVSPDFSAWFEVIVRDSWIATCTLGQWKWRSRWSDYSSRGSFPFLNYCLIVIPHFFRKFFVTFLLKAGCHELTYTLRYGKTSLDLLCLD
jgi:hypothetical protein